ncbi:Hypothetical protein GbCGDNIH9_8191 [Granulibacter bethesdensis]|uniref:Uncharacterized protein n=1 Tax=Granulibacter bethesdensis TaxID=364410 RepID=A0AAC9K6A0_9PROT|nr:Hypothetical protein GbCGDNIH9_8191 [Granulibacter bethesdensis]APH61264.1 Hypothetical protein GbCGDNIH8_8418 [Granulibacter bethesdensis]
MPGQWLNGTDNNEKAGNREQDVWQVEHRSPLRKRHSAEPVSPWRATGFS